MRFATLTRQPDDPLLRIIGQHAADPRPDKIDLGVGVFRDEAGHTPVMTAVKAAEARLLAEQSSKSYLGPEGDIGFVRALAGLVIGDTVAAERIVGLQTPGGTGALRLAAEVLAQSGARVTVYDAMPSAGRKFLMAGRGGLNLTHSEDFARLAQRYGAANAALRPMLEAFTPSDLIAWAQGLGQATFVGSSGRVFPTALKASPLLRAWLARLEGQGVALRTRAEWRGWDKDGALVFQTLEGSETVRPRATILALGGASWAKLGSDGAWAPLLEARGAAVAPFAAANSGLDVAWSGVFKDRFAGEPLKNIGLRLGEAAARGDAMIAGYGLEGGAVYALGAAPRAAIAATGWPIVLATNGTVREARGFTSST